LIKKAPVKNQDDKDPNCYGGVGKIEYRPEENKFFTADKRQP
jgi:hypothetical protein